MHDTLLRAELGATEEQAEIEVARGRRAVAAAHAETVETRVRRLLLGAELANAEGEGARLQTVVRQQKLAAKVLAMWDLMQMTALRRKQTRLLQQNFQMNALAVELPFRNKAPRS